MLLIFLNSIAFLWIFSPILGLIPQSVDEDTFIYLDYIYLRHKKKYGQKNAFISGSSVIVNSGHKRKEQRHLCKSCGKRFIIRKVVYSEALWLDYVFGKQTVFQLSERYCISRNTVRRRLDTIRAPRIISSLKRLVFLMNTTYRGRNFGVVVFKDWRTKRVLWRKFVRYETLAHTRRVLIGSRAIGLK